MPDVDDPKPEDTPPAAPVAPAPEAAPPVSAAPAAAEAAAEADPATDALPSEAPAAEAAAAEPAAAETAAAAAPAAAPDMGPVAVAARLAELFPALFAGTPPKPIKLRIQADIQQRAPGTFTKKSLSIFLHRHTTSTSYLKALAASTQRFDLDGQPAGELAEEHRQAAAAEVQRRHAVVMERPI